MSYSQAKCVSKYIFTCSVCGVVRENSENLTQGQQIRAAYIPEGWNELYGYPVCGTHVISGDLVVDGIKGFFSYAEGKWTPSV